MSAALAISIDPMAAKFSTGRRDRDTVSVFIPVLAKILAASATSVVVNLVTSAKCNMSFDRSPSASLWVPMIAAVSARDLVYEDPTSMTPLIAFTVP